MVEDRITAIVTEITKMISHFGSRCTVAIGHAMLGLAGETQGQTSVFSGVLIRLGDEIALVTAAHCIEEQRNYLRSGLNSVGVRLQWLGQPAFIVPNFIVRPELVDVYKLSRKQGQDYAVIRLPDAVEAKACGAGMIPISQSDCSLNVGTQVSVWGICGYPQCANRVDGRKINVRLGTIWTVEAERTEENADPTGPSIDQDPRCLLELAPNVAQDMLLPGMSGGLMLAIDMVDIVIGEDFVPVPRPVAIQSKWWRKKIAAGNVLSEIFEAVKAA